MKLSSATIRRPAAAFTMIEVAICLAIIGIALVGIIGVLPRGMNTQRDNRETTIIGQDANQLIEIIRNGARGQDDLTNYVYAVTNYWYWTNNGSVGSGYNGYTFSNANLTAVVGAAPPNNIFAVLSPLNSGSNIVGVLSTPEFMDTNGAPIPSLIEGGISNHVVAYVKALSGLAAEKPPQTNEVMMGDTFSYRVQCVNAPMAQNVPPVWESQSYVQGNRVYLDRKQWWWQPTNNASATDVPGSSPGWIHDAVTDQLSYSQRELRLRFLWPILPNGKVGNNYQNFRTTVGGQLVTNVNVAGAMLFYYRSQSFVQVP